jgi:hypothetical protein
MDPDKPEPIMLSAVCWPVPGSPNQILIFCNQHLRRTFNNIRLNKFIIISVVYMINGGFSINSATPYDVLCCRDDGFFYKRSA